MIQDKLAGVKTLRLLIGNTTNRETIEQISEGYKRLDLVEAAEEREQFLKKAEKKRRSEETAGNLRRPSRSWTRTTTARPSSGP